MTLRLRKDTSKEEVYSRGCIGSKKLGFLKKVSGGYYAFFPEKEYLTLNELYTALQNVEWKNDFISEKRAKERRRRDKKGLLICRGYGWYR